MTHQRVLQKRTAPWSKCIVQQILLRAVLVGGKFSSPRLGEIEEANLLSANSTDFIPGPRGDAALLTIVGVREAVAWPE